MSTISIRPARKEDMPRLLEIEKGATPGLQYLAGVEELFFDTSDGELIVADIDGVPAGFARFTVVPDGSAWLETLRVDPELWRMGVGRAIWDRIIELSKKFNVTAMRMYTTFDNEGSKKLAYNHKLDIALHTREYSLMLDGVDAPDAPAFKCIKDPDAADAALMPYLFDYKGYYITNRTFYAANPATTRWLAEDGKVYATENAAMVCGSRFLHETALHFGLMGGDLDACIAFAIAEGKRLGVPKVVTMVVLGDEARANALEARGFKMAASEIIMMERML